MKSLLRVCLIAALLLCHVLSSRASEHEKRKGEEFESIGESTDSNIKGKGNDTTAHGGRSEAVTPGKKVKKTGNQRISVGPRSDISCTRLGGVCQPKRYICQGRYLEDKCQGARTQQCCTPVGAWSVLCAGHHNNRVRACDVHGCGAFNSQRGNGLHKAVDLVCDDYGIVNAPFSGTLAGPVTRKDRAGNRYDGVKLLSDGTKRWSILPAAKKTPREISGEKFHQRRNSGFLLLQKIMKRAAAGSKATVGYYGGGVWVRRMKKTDLQGLVKVFEREAETPLNSCLPLTFEDPVACETPWKAVAHCVKIFNVRPYRYLGPVAQGQALGYLLPLQERFSGITSHLALQMCDGTDPSRFI